MPIYRVTHANLIERPKIVSATVGRDDPGTRHLIVVITLRVM